MRPPTSVSRTAWRIVAAGAVSVVVLGLAGWALERARFGPDAAASRSRLEAEVTGRFDQLAGELDAAIAQVTPSADTVRAAEQRDATATIALFDLVEAAAAGARGGRITLTIYGTAGQPLAWVRSSAGVPPARLSTPALFLAPNAQGLQLVRAQPLTDAASPPRQVGAVVAEVLVAPGGENDGGDYTLDTGLGTVNVRTAVEAAADAGPDTFQVRSASGDVLAAVSVPAGALAAARTRLRNAWAGAELSLFAIFVLLLAGPLGDWRRATRSVLQAGVLAAATAVALIFARALLWIAVRRFDIAAPALTTTGSWAALPALMLASPIDFLLTSLVALGLVGLAASAFGEWRAGHRAGIGVWPIESRGQWTAFCATQIAAGGIVTLLVVNYEAFLRTHLAQAPVDIVRFTIDPGDSVRLLVVSGAVLLNAAVAGLAALVLRVAVSPWVSGGGRAAIRWRALAGWLAPAALVALPRVADRSPVLPAAIAIVVIALGAALVPRLRVGLRKSSQAARLMAAFAAVVIPSIVFYPSLVDAAARARRQLVETRYAPEVINQRRDLQVRLRQALMDIDRIEGLPALVNASTPPVSGPPATDAAFLVWSQTGLDRQRLTSSVELHNAAGVMVSRFALKLPDFPQAWIEQSCDWEVLEEVSPFFSEERRLLHAGRGICERGTRRQVGSIVVHVMLDYGNLSFISAENPYIALLRSGRPRPEPRLRTDVDFTVYGWSRRVLYTSRASAPPLPDEVYRRAFQSRDPFWARVSRPNASLDAYVLNDRGAIYVLGMARPTLFDHLVALAEMVTLAFVLFTLLVGGGQVFGLVSSGAPASGRALLAEVRASFYRKLFLAFVAAAIGPVLAMALVARAYIASLVFADIEGEATRTATLASRVVEDFGSLQARGQAGLPVVDDNLVVWLSRVIAQDVNIFDANTILASSERNLFASGLLPARTPGDAYRAILLDGRPSFVGRDVVGGLEYLVAAAPVRVQDRDAVLTVPLASRQQEIEAQIAELDRRVLLAALLFIMAGAGLGYSMAERIADPVNRLMRATQRIARGELDVRVLATSSDELQRLVLAFNQMADDLLRQRRELERTNRLQAWADMARQVAHDIKNPLTPIQLNAEHLRRVHADRGGPMGPVIDECINNILAQVRLLRQLASEFSSFASAPSPQPAPCDVTEVAAEVVEPYRAGLGERVSIVVDAAADLPLVTADRVLLGRALVNVVENALHAMPGGGRLTVTLRRAIGGATIDVSDTGVGMDAEALGRIFEPYFSTKATGTGLGLTIAKRNVELTGGSIAVSSTPGQGTTVSITLPAA